MHKQSLSLNRRGFIRLLVITIAAVLIFYMIGLYLNDEGIRTVRSDLQSAMDQQTRYIATQINREVGSLVSQCQELASNKDLLRYAIAHSTFSDYNRMVGIIDLSDQLLRIKRFSELVETAEIFLPEIERVIVTDRTIYNTMDEREWERLSAALGHQSWQLAEHERSQYLLFGSSSQTTPLFLISVCISPERLLARTAAMSSDQKLELVLRRADGSVLVSTEEGEGLLRSGQPGGGLFGFSKEDCLIAAAQIPTLQLELVCISRSDDALEPLLRRRMWIWLLTLLGGGLLVGYLAYFRHFILRPLSTIADTMRRAEKTGHFHIDQSSADFDDLYAQFNSMMEHMEVLNAQIYEERLRAQQSEIRQLQMQINPHFFYNTLFLVYRMAQAEGCEEIAQLSLNLSNYYRYITKLPEHDVPLRSEVRHIRNYLEIQGVRFAPRVQVRLGELPEGIAEERIPPLILQPLVENAFVHGVKNKSSGGIVEVGFSLDEERFGVTVYDNGGEMDEQSVRQLDERMRSGQLPEGSALFNLYRRMELCYGSRYALKLESVADGLRVSILFPRTRR